MEQPNEDSLLQIKDLDGARLALRGALAAIRDLQAINMRLKRENQDEATRRLSAETLSGELSARLEELRGQAAGWKEELRRLQSRENEWRQAARLEARAEEKGNMAEARRVRDEKLDRLRAELARMASFEREREEVRLRIQKKLESCEARLLACERERLQCDERLKSQAQAAEASALQLKDRLADRERELEEKRREAADLRRELEELGKRLGENSAAVEAQVAREEEKLLAEFRAKERALAAKYDRAQAEMEFSWAEFQRGLWKKTKESRELLNKAALEQHQERERALERRLKDGEAELAARSQALDEEERRLFEGWAVKEKRFEQKFAEELAREKAALRKDSSGAQPKSSAKP